MKVNTSCLRAQNEAVLTVGRMKVVLMRCHGKTLGLLDCMEALAMEYVFCPANSGQGLYHTVQAIETGYEARGKAAKKTEAQICIVAASRKAPHWGSIPRSAQDPLV